MPEWEKPEYLNWNAKVEEYVGRYLRELASGQDRNDVLRRVADSLLELHLKSVLPLVTTPEHLGPFASKIDWAIGMIVGRLRGDLSAKDSRTLMRYLRAGRHSWFGRASAHAAGIPETPGQAKDAIAEGNEVASAPVQPATEFSGTGGKRGPKPDHETALRVAEIVKRVAPDGAWRSKLDDICDALDEEKIPIPARWRRNRECQCWSDCIEPQIVIKAIQYRLELVGRRTKPTPETLS